MFYISLAFLTFGFIGLATIITAVMCCDIVEKNNYNNSDLYQYADRFVKRYGGILCVRIVCLTRALPISLFLLITGFTIFTIEHYQY